MDAESFTSNDVRKRIEQLSKSFENRIKSKQNRNKFYFTEEDDEILDSNAMEISSEPGNWLYVSDQCTTGEQSKLENHILESMSAMVTDDVASVINQSRRSFDSRTYTRPKKQQQRPQPAFITSQDSFRMDCTVKSGSPSLHPFGGPNLTHLNSCDDSTMESSLGIIDINNLTESQQLDFEKASTEQRQCSSSTPPQSLEALNVTYEKDNSTRCIASDEPLNSTFTLDEGLETSPPTRQNSKFARNCLPEPGYNSKLTRNQVSDASNVGYSSKIVGNRLINTDQNSTFDKNQMTVPSSTPQNSKFYNTHLPDPTTVTQKIKFAKNDTSSITLNSKYARSESPEASALSYGSKFLRNHSPEPSPFCQNSKFPKKPLYESTPLVKNSHFAQKFTTNNHGDDLEEVGINGDEFSSTLNKDSDDIINISFPSMMQSSTSLQGDSKNTTEVNPNATIDKKRSSFGAARFKTSLDSCEDDSPNLSGRASEVNPNLTIDKRRASEVNPKGKRRVSLGRCENTGEDDPNERRSDFEVNPNSTKRRISLGQGRSSTTSEDSNFEVNPNATIEKIRNFEVDPNTTVDRRRSTTPQVRSSEDPNLDNIEEVNPNTTVEKGSNFEVNPNTTVEKRSEVNPNTTVEKVINSERNPYLTMNKRKSAIIAQQLKSSSTENIMVNNLNANYQECLKNSERLQVLRDRLEGEVPSKQSQVTPPHAEDFLGEPVSFSTPSRGGGHSQKSSPRFTNGEDSSTEISPVSLEDCVSPRASSVPPLDGTFCKNAGDSFSKKGAKLLEGGASPLNSTFRKQALSSTFCKSAETLNNGGGGTVGGSVESGPEEDGMSTASDSSFSSSSTHMRSVGEIQSIARLQEESLSLQNNTALRKIAWGGSDSGDGDLTKGNQTVFRKQATMSDDGNQSDHSERCSPSSERCSPTALNNNLRNVSRLSLKPLSSYSRIGGLSMQHARSVEQLPSGMSLARPKQSTFGLKRPTVVSKQPLNNTTLPQPAPAMAPPSSRLQAPSKPSGIRPPTAIPRPVSRLPAPKIKTGLPRYNGKSSGQS